MSGSLSVQVAARLRTGAYASRRAPLTHAGEAVRWIAEFVGAEHQEPLEVGAVNFRWAAPDGSAHDLPAERLSKGVYACVKVCGIPGGWGVVASCEVGPAIASHSFVVGALPGGPLPVPDVLSFNGVPLSFVGTPATFAI
ncbi:hypothetical protein [Roseomonas haemaphysalidis]|uniref:Uncharacterized protein n=1 Tax=Roseomonas haemaphysalidis TaxID=2768162 RepID=A0ABS3KKV3_9PROT|nr:hypothetical protein [Roseomonas haemaphysalidis]MBO1078100.1 hypothetical protein [Roseomonas haemaphysalidis]